MSRNILFTTTILAGLAMPCFAQKKGTPAASKTDVKFIDDITVSAAPVTTTISDPKAEFSTSLFTTKKPIVNRAATSIEKAGELQFKYAVLLDTEVEDILNMSLFQTLDEWLGTQYKLGGTGKDGVDCSALMQSLFSSVYNIVLPRTAKEQFSATARISRTELQEGDLVFFNTTGGVSHVGMYLQNNKFVHASSGGVTISDLYEDYWLRKFVGAGRMELTSTAKP